MFEFNARGLLVPDSNIVCTFNDFKSTFVDNVVSKTRKQIFENYIEYSTELKQLLNVDQLTQWVNGSFVSKTANPKDIDLLTFIEATIYLENFEKIEKFLSKTNWNSLGVDAYLIPIRNEKDALYYRYESDRLHWMHHFSRTRKDIRSGKNLRKGFLEINY